jgi:thiol-disulfide isomerase/thioredoxin
MIKTIASILVCLTCNISNALAQTPGEVEVGGILREAHLHGLSGPSKKLSDYRGKPLIINVWASWCGPCRDEMGSMQRLARRYGGKQFNVIGISTDDYREPALAFLKESTTTFANYIDSNLLMENMLGANRIPLTLLVDAKGKVIEKIQGAQEWDSPQALELIKKSFHSKM